MTRVGFVLISHGRDYPKIRILKKPVKETLGQYRNTAGKTEVLREDMPEN